jgi:hypothetical protein
MGGKWELSTALSTSSDMVTFVTFFITSNEIYDDNKIHVQKKKDKATNHAEKNTTEQNKRLNNTNPTKEGVNSCAPEG